MWYTALVADRWTNLAPGDRERIAEVVEDLLHDWIKYMEMRLNSIDWSRPPEDAAEQLERAVCRTRHLGERTLGARQIVDAQRARLAGLAHHPSVARLWAAVEGDLSGLEALLRQDPPLWRTDPDAFRAVIRQPGRRLRALRDELADG